MEWNKSLFFAILCLFIVLAFGVSVFTQETHHFIVYYFMFAITLISTWVGFCICAQVVHKTYMEDQKAFKKFVDRQNNKRAWIRIQEAREDYKTYDKSLHADQVYKRFINVTD